MYGRYIFNNNKLPHHNLIAANSSAGFRIRDILPGKEVYACSSTGYCYIDDGAGNMIVVIHFPAGNIADVYTACEITIGCADGKAAMIGVGVDGKGLRRYCGSIGNPPKL